VNAEQASKRTMRRSTRSCKRGRLIRLGEREQGDDLNRCAGVLAAACTQGKARATREAYGVGRMTNRTLVRAGSGRHKVTERLVVPMKPGNAGGGKGPQFRTNAKT